MTGIAANALSDQGGHGIAYEAHIYDNKGSGEPGIWNTSVTVAVKAGYCVIIGEFGPATDGSQDNSGCTPFESDLIKWIEGANSSNYVYSAMAWSFNTDATPRLLANWNFGATSCHGSQVKTWLASVKPSTCSGTAMPPKALVSVNISNVKGKNYQVYTITGKVIGRSSLNDAPVMKSGVYLCRSGNSIVKTFILKGASIKSINGSTGSP